MHHLPLSLFVSVYLAFDCHSFAQGTRLAISEGMLSIAFGLSHDLF